jgi:hypothetical protein
MACKRKTFLAAESRYIFWKIHCHLS